MTLAFNRRYSAAAQDHGAASVFEAYFDETGSHDDAEVLSIAGFILESNKAAEMRLRWQEVLDVNQMPFLHMKDFDGGGGPYRHLADAKRIAIQRQLHAILYDAAICGIVISVSKDAFIQSGLRDSALPNPYALCCYLALIAVSRALGERRQLSHLSFFFEEGHRHQSMTNEPCHFYSAIMKRSLMRSSQKLTAGRSKRRICLRGYTTDTSSTSYTAETTCVGICGH